MTSETKLDIIKDILALGDIWGKSDQAEMLDCICILHCGLYGCNVKHPIWIAYKAYCFIVRKI